MDEGRTASDGDQGTRCSLGLSTPCGCVDPLHRFQGIDILRSLVRANADNSREPQRKAALVTRAALNAVEGDFEDYERLNEPKAAEFLRCVLFKEVGHLENLGIRQT